MHWSLKLLGFLLVLASGWYFFIPTPPTTSAHVIALLRSNNTALSEAEISLDGCQLSILHQAISADEQSNTKSASNVDLGLFRFDQFRVSPLADESAVLKIDRRPLSESLLDQAEMLAALFPSNAPVATTSELRSQLRDALSLPDAKLTFRLINMIPMNDDEPVFKPHEDGPEFYNFAQAVDALDAPKTYSMGLTFLGREARADTFFAGSIVFPNELIFKTLSIDHAKALTAMLHRYQQQQCP